MSEELGSRVRGRNIWRGEWVWQGVKVRQYLKVVKARANEVSDDENGEIKGGMQQNPGVIYKTG
jgi:hypothetical protein